MAGRQRCDTARPPTLTFSPARMSPLVRLHMNDSTNRFLSSTDTSPEPSSPVPPLGPRLSVMAAIAARHPV